MNDAQQDDIEEKRLTALANLARLLNLTAYEALWLAPVLKSLTTDRLNECQAMLMLQFNSEFREKIKELIGNVIKFGGLPSDLPWRKK